MSVPQIKDLHGAIVEPYWANSIHCSNYIIRVDATYAGLTETLGKIKPRDDGRLDWFRFKTRYYKNQWSGVAQGVANTFSEAMVAIEKGWLAGESKSG